MGWTWRSDEVEAGLVQSVEEWARDAKPAVQRAVATLLEENARLRVILGHCPRGIAVLDDHGNLIGYNRELSNLLGSVAVLGEPIDRFFEPEDRAVLRQVTESARDGRRSAGVLRVQGGVGREIEFFAATLPSETDRVSGVILAGEDRTAALRDDSDRASMDEANVRTAFDLAMGAVRHEIGGLLTTALEALESGTNTPVALEALRQTEVLLRRTALPPPPERATEACAVAESARRAARFALVGDARRRCMVQVAIDDGLRVAVGERHLTQVLANLVHNAVGAVLAQGTVGVVRIEAHADDGRVFVRVHDDGVGIEPAKLQGVFEPSESGLGLAIARLTIERAGGAIRVVSEPGSGTTVSFDLPQAT